MAGEPDAAGLDRTSHPVAVFRALMSLPIAGEDEVCDRSTLGIESARRPEVAPRIGNALQPHHDIPAE